MNLQIYQTTRIRELQRTINFERSRDEMGQFAGTSDTTPEKMRLAYVKPLRERLKFARRR